MLNTNTQRVSLSLLFIAAAAFGQTTPAFEVASIKKVEPLTVNSIQAGQMHVGLTIDAAMVHMTSMSLTEMLRYAYKVKSFQVSGPDWLAVQRFDISAKMPAGANRDQVPDMLQALLADRFKLTLHRSTTEQSVYAIVVTRSGALKESPPDSAETGAPGGPASPTAPTPTDGGVQVRASAVSDGSGISTRSVNGNVRMLPSDSGMRIEMTKMNTTGMTELLGRFVDRPVVDMTDLKGKYDLTLDVGVEDMMALARAAGMAVPLAPSGDAGRASEPGSSSVFAAIQQYGLKLEPRKAPIELLVIDHVEKTPTEN